MEINQKMQELCECAWEQGFGEMAKIRPGVFLPSISKKVQKKLLEISTSFHGKVKA